MKPSQPTPPAAESALTALADTACYLVVPHCPRDVWYGVPAAPESYQLVAFVESRHAHINPAFDAQYLADALNEKASRSSSHAHARLMAENAAAQQRIAELEAELAVIRKAVEAVLPDIESGYIGNPSVKAQRRADRHCKALRAALTLKPRA